MWKKIFIKAISFTEKAKKSEKPLNTKFGCCLQGQKHKQTLQNNKWAKSLYKK